MLARGRGRGRGCLKFAKNTSPLPRPGPDEGSCVTASKHSSTMPGIENTAYSDRVDLQPEKYNELVKRVSHLSAEDDGILFNQKVKLILDYWRLECDTEEEVVLSFEALYNACLLNSELASKFIRMVASRSFPKHEIKSQNFRRLFLVNLQKNFDECDNLRNKNSVMFRNSVLMIGEFFNKARFCNGEAYSCLAIPFIDCLKMLLDARASPELGLFTTQLYLNGSMIMAAQPDETRSLLVKVRTIIATESNLSKESKLWLLLALDVASLRFAILPSHIFKFYEEQLGSIAIANFQRPDDTLHIQTVLFDDDKSNSYQCNVNVPQISSPPSEKNEKIPFERPTPPIHNNITNMSNDFSTNIGGGKGNEVADKPCPGRQILGVGARLNKYRSNGNNNTGNWKSGYGGHRENSAGWNSKHKNTSGSTWGMDTKKEPRIRNLNKTWKFDDRFDTIHNNY